MWDENVSHVKFVAFDTETTGVETETDSIVELAAVCFDEDYEHRRFETLVRPGTPIPPGATRVHGITDADVSGAPAAPAAIGDFLAFLEWSGNPRVLLAHNAGFDVAMVHSECRRARSKELAAGRAEVVLDTCMLAKNLIPEIPQHGLEALTRHLGIESARMHRAMSDVLALREVFMKLLGLAADRAANRDKGFTLDALVDIAGGYFLLAPGDAVARGKAFRLPPRISALESLCGTEARVGIVYESENDYRYITPVTIRMRGFKVYVDAFCHRDNVRKTFRADRILSIGKVEPAC
jgi:DNA polymerase III epsilon subunit family exonuclease